MSVRAKKERDLKKSLMKLFSSSVQRYFEIQTTGAGRFVTLSAPSAKS
jgi:hypothetical protein